MEFEKLIETDEKVLYANQPNAVVYIASTTAILIIALLSSIVIAVIVSQVIPIDPKLHALLIGGYTSLMMFICIFSLTWNILSQKYTRYVLTNKRVIIQSGVIGRDFSIIPYVKITNLHLRVGLFDKLFGKNTGSILIYTAGSRLAGHRSSVSTVPDAFYALENPMDVYNLIKERSGVDIPKV